MTKLQNVIANAWIMVRRSSFYATMISFAGMWLMMQDSARLEWLTAHGVGFMSPYLVPLFALAVIVAFVFPQPAVSDAVIRQAVLNVAERTPPIVDEDTPSVHLPPPPMPFTPPTSTPNESEQHT